jgi:hypothetical protein
MKGKGMKLTIAINCRQDPRLTWTLDNIARVTSENDRPEVIVVFDGNQKRPDLSKYPFVRAVQPSRSAMGTSYSRHMGVMEAKHEAVITCDSHIDFTVGALDILRDSINESPHALICAICRMTGGKETNDYYGADLFEYVDGKENAVTVRGSGERVAVAGKWRKETTTGVIGCIMGGCYGLTRSTYIHAGEPWKYGRGWGCDEESAAIAWAACGYVCLLVNAVVIHEYQKKPTYKHNALDVKNVWYNRYRATAMLCRGDKKKLMDMIGFMGSSCGKETHLYAMQALEDVQPWVDYIAGQSKSVMARPKRIERKPRVESTVVMDRGTPCRKCEARYSMRTLHVWPNGNRRACCEKCGTIHTIIRET